MKKFSFLIPQVTYMSMISMLEETFTDQVQIVRTCVTNDLE